MITLKMFTEEYSVNQTISLLIGLDRIVEMSIYRVKTKLFLL